MKKILLFLALALGSSYAFAGTTDCHTPIETIRTVTPLEMQNFVEVTAKHFDSGCASNLQVTLKFLRPLAGDNLTSIDFMVIHDSRALGFPYPANLDKSKFKVINNSEVQINGLLRLGDTLYIDIPAVPILPFHIE